MPWGTWANAAITGLAAVLYAMACVRAARRPREHRTGRSAVPALFACIALFLAFASFRQVAAALAEQDPWWTKVDLAAFMVLLLPAAFAIVPLVYLLASIRSASPRIPPLAAAMVAVPAAIGVAFAFVDGVSGPIPSDYGTDWSINSPVTRILLLVDILLPALLGSLWLIWLARGIESPQAARRMRLVGWSCLVYFTVFTVDAFALAGLWLLGARVATAAAGLVAWRAYAPDLVEAPAPPPT